MGCSGDMAGSLEIGSDFFERYELDVPATDFVVDKERFGKFVRLTRCAKWAELRFDNDTKKLQITMAGANDSIMNFNATYYHADYADGFMTRDHVYANIMSFGCSDFLELVSILKRCEFLF